MSYSMKIHIYETTYHKEQEQIQVEIEYNQKLTFDAPLLLNLFSTQLHTQYIK
jgi:hypothetical protein